MALKRDIIFLRYQKLSASYDVFHEFMYGLKKTNVKFLDIRTN